MTNTTRPIRGSFSARTPRVLPLPLPLLLLLACAGHSAAHAAPDPVAPGPLASFHPYVALGYFHDDNLFRLADDRPAFDNQRSDSARYATGGFFFDKMFSRQKVYAQAKLSKVKFNHFKQLDYDGKDLLGLWNWQLGNQFEGSLGASYEQTLAPYIDFRSSERNLRVHKRQHFDGAWKMHPSWQLRAGAASDKYEYELSAQKINNRTEDMVEAGFDYTPRSGSTAGLVVRRLKGKYSNKRFVGGAPINDDFTQDEIKARVNWKVTGITSIQVLAGYAKRKHAVLGPRNAKGLNGRVTASLNPRKKLRVNASAWREFAPIESNMVTYSLNRGASVGASWDATAKVRVDAALSKERRNYDGRLVMNAPQDISDRLSTASLGATWQARPTMQVTTAYAHQRRKGADFLGNGSFTSNTVSVSASAQF
jgi:exopolysaccharide biosynthesis operon protein EpsL